MQNGFAVVLEEHRRLDAALDADRAGPFVAEDLDAGRAEALRLELAEAGVRAHVVPPGKLVAARDPDPVRTLRIADDALHLTLGYTGPVLHVAWGRIVLLSAGKVAGEIDVGLADVFARCDDRLLHVRLRSRDLNYELILGRDFARDPGRDFREVLARIGERAGGGFVTPGYRAACLGPKAAGVDTTEEADWRFGDEERFGVYNRWRLQMIMLGIGIDTDTDIGGDADLAGPAGPALVGPRRALVGNGDACSTANGPAEVSASRDREMREIERRAESAFALAGKALRGIVALAFIALVTWSWLRPGGYAPNLLLGFALGDLTAMIFVIVNPAFAETIRGYHPDGFAVEALAFIFLGFYWSGASLGDGGVGGLGVELGTDIFVIAGAMGVGFIARLLAALARDAESGV